MNLGNILFAGIGSILMLLYSVMKQKYGSKILISILSIILILIFTLIWVPMYTEINLLDLYINKQNNIFKIVLLIAAIATGIWATRIYRNVRELKKTKA